MTKIDKALKSFKEFAQQFDTYKSIDLSESDTRSKILDNLLLEVLGWKEANIIREGHNEKGYFDYKLVTPTLQFVIEAKKNFDEFKLPNRQKKSKINTLYKANDHHIKQIRNYIFEESLQFGVLTNGHQFIIGKFINFDGTNWKDNTAKIFNGFEDIEKRFIEFYDLLSKEAVSNNSLFQLSREDIIEGKTIFSTLGNKKHRELIRNDLTSNLTPILSEIFGEIYKYEDLNNKELLKACFIKNEETKKNKSEIEKLIEDKPPELSEVIPVVNTDNTVKDIESTLTESTISKDSIPPDPIIIIGSKGAGKTTFIHYLYEISLDDEFKTEKPFVYIDFRKYDDLTHEKEKLFRDILEYIDTNNSDFDLYDLTVLKRTFYKEIDQYNKGIWKYDKENNESVYQEKLSKFLEEATKNYEDHFIKLSKYLIRERRRRLTIIIDNADQKNAPFQKEAYLFAAGLNRQAQCSVIISLREGYYYLWRNKPPFDAFESNVYHVTAAPYSDVLKARIDYALKKIDFDQTSSGYIKNKSVTISPETIKNFFLNIDKTLFANENSEMLRYLEQTSYPNIREGLESFKHFLVSGHTNVHKYVIQLDKHIIPIWEFIKSLALDNKLFYNHEISRINNLFFPSENNLSHFTKVRILKYLYKKTKKLGFKEKFVQCSEIIELFKTAGYTEEVIIEELNTLIDNKLIESDNNITDIENPDSNCLLYSYSISFKGFYYLDELINKFHYINLILQDTPIFEKEYFEKLIQCFPETDETGYQNLKERRDCVLLFLDYLETREKKELLNKDNLDDVLTYSVTEEIKSKGLLKDIKRVNKNLPFVKSFPS